jgi:hypothetical protein
MKAFTRIFAISVLLFLIGACASLKPFHEYARAGDSIAIPVGKQPEFNRDNITVTITPSSGSPLVLAATDPAVRAVINFYPDPVSSILVSNDINEDITSGAQLYHELTYNTAAQENDWFQTIVFLDIPAGIPTGQAQIAISIPGGPTHTSTIQIIDGVGTANGYNAYFEGATLKLNEDMLRSLSRVSHTVVDVVSATLPYAVEMTFTHDPDITIGGTGKYSVINPTSGRKTLQWSDDGTNLKVILLEAHAGSISEVKDFKYYIAGSASNLQLNSVNGYDSTGAEISGVSASLVPPQ